MKTTDIGDVMNKFEVLGIVGEGKLIIIYNYWITLSKGTRLFYTNVFICGLFLVMLVWWSKLKTKTLSDLVITMLLMAVTENVYNDQRVNIKEFSVLCPKTLFAELEINYYSKVPIVFPVLNSRHLTGGSTVG